MKRYIRASLDPSMPAWLRNQPVVQKLGETYALSQAKFYNEPQENSVPIYLLDTVYKATTKKDWRRNWTTTTYTELHDFAYCPEIVTDFRSLSILVGEKHISMGAIPRYRKSRELFDSLIKDTTYMIAPLRSEYRADGYVDPRYERERDGSWRYLGQKAHPSYNKKTRKWDGEPEWYSATTYDGKQNRDKSGYEIPYPADLYTRLYTKFPEKLRAKLDEIGPVLEEYYTRLQNCQSKVFGIDIREGRGFNPLGNQGNINAFNKAVEAYGNLYSMLNRCINEDDTVNSTAVANFIHHYNYYSNRLDTALAQIEQ